VAKPERLVYKHEPEEGCEPVNFEVTVTFAWERGNTRVTMRMLFPSAEERERVVQKYGAVEGAHQTLGRLAQHLLPNRDREGVDAPIRELVITRVFDAPRKLVFKAWTEPERLKRWWGPNGFTNAVCEIDPRPGGTVRIHMRGPDGTVYPNQGVVQEIVPPERLVLAMGVADAQGNIILEGVSIVTFTEQAGKTTLTLRARITKATAEAAPHLSGMEHGWNQSLDHLAAELAAETKELFA
jgi:uncharacterized protein YndB with AHSA1/START domain